MVFYFKLPLSLSHSDFKKTHDIVRNPKNYLMSEIQCKESQLKFDKFRQNGLELLFTPIQKFIFQNKRFAKYKMSMSRTIWKQTIKNLKIFGDHTCCITMVVICISIWYTCICSGLIKCMRWSNCCIPPIPVIQI